MSSNVKYYLSGGTYNTDPAISLGGLISQQEVQDIINGLFPRVSNTELSDGSNVYRCLYVVNTGSTTLQNIRLSLEQGISLSTVYLGVKLATEIQLITMSGNPYGGTFTLRYIAVINGAEVSQTTNNIQFDPDPDVMTYNIQTALNDLLLLDDVVVQTNRVDDTWRYSVIFEGSHDHRKHRTLEVASNNIIGDDISFLITVSTEGSPINTTASNIGFSNQAPIGATFTTSQITVGDLELLDGMAIWLRRTTNPDTIISTSKIDDVVLNIIAEVET